MYVPVFGVIDGCVDVRWRHGALRVDEVAARDVHACVGDLRHLPCPRESLLRVRRGAQRAAGCGTLLDGSRPEIQQLHSGKKIVGNI